MPGVTPVQITSAGTHLGPPADEAALCEFLGLAMLTCACAALAGCGKPGISVLLLPLL